MLARRAAIERRRREFSFGVLMGSFFVLIITLFYIDFVVNVVAPKVLHGDGGVALYIVVGAAVVAAPLVAAFALGRYQPGVAFLVVLIALNVFVLGVLAVALFSLARVIGSSFVTSLVRAILHTYVVYSYMFQLYYFYGAYHSVTYVQLEDGTNESDVEVGNRTPE